jgi:hypothetical protein
MITPVVGGWVGNHSKHFYRSPQESAESAMLQERKLAQTSAAGRQWVEHGHEFEYVGRMPDGVQPGSKEWFLYQVQDDALSRLQHESLEKTTMGYAQFSNVHQYVPDNEYNEREFLQYFELTGKQIVDHNGGRVPLDVSASDWEQASQWLIQHGRLQLDQAKMDGAVQDMVRNTANQTIQKSREELDTDSMYSLSMDELRDKARRAWER